MVMGQEPNYGCAGMQTEREREREEFPCRRMLPRSEPLIDRLIHEFIRFSFIRSFILDHEAAPSLKALAHQNP